VDVRGRGDLRTTQATSRRMSAQASQNTQIELRLRSLLHAKGLRYRIHHRPLGGRRRVADLAFVRSKVAVFVDGCFWHGCPLHGTWPTRNAKFWREKIETNINRDRSTDALLVEAGWIPVRVWEHEEAELAAERIEVLVKSRSVR
jgi:DNA mismatch endonuclease, patch repair protein